MRCRNCRKLVFDFRDGTRETSEIDRVKAHLEACVLCREYYAREERIGRALKTVGELELLSSGPALAVANLVDAMDRSLQRPSLGASATPNEIQSQDRARPYRRIWSRLLPFSLAAAGILAAVFVGPAIIHRGEPARSILDDLADPLGDWLEAKMIVIIENPVTGKSETFVSTRSEGIRPLQGGRTIR